ncbi:hypothetical protein [Halorubrum sp. CBA1125]|nr:hypothetical protein [Halorubrum sp. CBA1125]
MRIVEDEPPDRNSNLKKLAARSRNGDAEAEVEELKEKIKLDG